MKSAIPKSLLFFGLVGSVGFVIDGGLLTLLISKYGFNVYLARAVSFSIACFATWLLNRRLVFKVGDIPAREKRREYGRYLSVQIGGALINLLIFSCLIWAVPAFATMPIIPFFFGAVGGLVFNFSGARLLVFRKT